MKNAIFIFVIMNVFAVPCMSQTKTGESPPDLTALKSFNFDRNRILSDPKIAEVLKKAIPFKIPSKMSEIPQIATFDWSRTYSLENKTLVSSSGAGLKFLASETKPQDRVRITFTEEVELSTFLPAQKDDPIVRTLFSVSPQKLVSGSEIDLSDSDKLYRLKVGSDILFFNILGEEKSGISVLVRTK